MAVLAVEVEFGEVVDQGDRLLFALVEGLSEPSFGIWDEGWLRRFVVERG